MKLIDAFRKARHRLADVFRSPPTATVKPTISGVNHDVSSHTFVKSANVYVTSCSTEAERITTDILRRVDSRPWIMGLDAEWRPTFTKNTPQSPVATLQLGVDSNTCYIFQLCYFRTFPPSLKKLLADEQILKVGVQVRGDGTKLARDYGVDCNGFVDVVDIAQSHQLTEKGMKTLALKTMGLEISKSSRSRMSNWELPLSNRQLEYAAADAWLSSALFWALFSMGAKTGENPFQFCFRSLPQQDAVWQYLQNQNIGQWAWDEMEEDAINYPRFPLPKLFEFEVNAIRAGPTPKRSAAKFLARKHRQSQIRPGTDIHALIHNLPSRSGKSTRSAAASQANASTKPSTKQSKASPASQADSANVRVCSKCKKTKCKSQFTKTQLRKRIEDRVCKSCAAQTNQHQESGFQCCSCHKRLPSAAFSASQGRRPSNKRRCRSCLAKDGIIALHPEQDAMEHTQDRLTAS